VAQEEKFFKRYGREDDTFTAYIDVALGFERLRWGMFKMQKFFLRELSFLSRPQRFQ
jgi:hypothetical protein